ncbi:hypothetical protein B0H16DRAFT_1880560 [Mycena metata]|uniref:Uncharacterized protein n=1 Tax=Mycena metata TaxID=1033252 RepID=A0AAD7JYC6_9AGAR|nr:hypothetical protein B0H16DRAFT_1880560 [Mycena metata]
MPTVQATLLWPVSPEFENALALATQRHLAQPPASPATAPSTPQLAHSPLQHPHSLGVPSPETPSPGSVPRSASLMMKTRVAVRDKTPHRFQVVPLRDIATREKAPSVKQPSAAWTRQLAVLRPSGVGLGLNMRSTVTDTPERGRERTRQSDVIDATPVGRKGILRGLQGLSPKRQIGSPDGKENRAPGSRDTTRSPSKRGRRRREYTFDSTRSFEIPTFAGDATTTIQDGVIPTPAEESTSHTTQENTSIDINFPELLAALSRDSFVDEDITITELKTQAVSDVDSSTKSSARTRISRHFKSPSLGAIHHLLSASTPTTAPDLPDNTPRVRCRKRTNTLSVAHASTKSKRYGVYTPGKLDFSPVASPEDARNSTYSLGALLSAYSFDSLPSMYSQDSFVGDGAGTRPLCVRVRQLQGQAVEGQAHPIVMQLIREVEIAIGEWA